MTRGWGQSPKSACEGPCVEWRHCHLFMLVLIYLFIPVPGGWKNKLRLVRIFFDTPTFVKIERDKAAKFVDMLSAIGGTMGLLTGFSIISGVEILFFAAKIGWNIFQRQRLHRN